MTRPTKCTKDLINKVYKLLSSDTYTVREVAEQCGISETSFYEYQNRYTEFAKAVKKAEEARLDKFKAEAKKSLLKKLTGFEVTETEVVTIPGGMNGKPTIKEQKTKKRFILPDTAAIIFTLTNVDSSNWRNRQTTELTGKDGQPLPASEGHFIIDPEELSEEELELFYKLAKKRDRKKQE